MGYDLKYGKVTTEHGNIPVDEPVVVFRARDMTTVDVLTYYLARCARVGSPPRHLELIIKSIQTFRHWQKDNILVKAPASESSREWMSE